MEANLYLIRWCIGSQRCAYRQGETWSSFDNQKTTWDDFVLDILKFWREQFSSVEDGICEFVKAQLGYTPPCMVSEGKTPEEAGFQAMTEAANTKAFSVASTERLNWFFRLEMGRITCVRQVLFESVLMSWSRVILGLVSFFLSVFFFFYFCCCCCCTCSQVIFEHCSHWLQCISCTCALHKFTLPGFD